MAKSKHKKLFRGKGKKEDRELWYKIIISRVQLVVLLSFAALFLLIFTLIYFDKIVPVIEWRLSKIEQKIHSQIEQAKISGAQGKELHNFQGKLSHLKEEREDGGSLISFRDDLINLSRDLDLFLSNLKNFERGYFARITRVVNEVLVNVKDSLSWESNVQNKTLGSGDKVKTGEDLIAEITTDSGNKLCVNPESMIIIKDLSRNRDTFKPMEVYSISESPNADFHINTRQAPLILEDSNTLINVNKSSEVKIHKREKSATISVFRGHVAVENDQGETRELITRQALNISGNGIFLATESIPYPPELLEPPNLYCYRFTGPEEVKIKLRWSKQEKINKYELHVSTSIDFRTLLLNQIVNGLSYDLSGLESGNYFWRLSSIPSEEDQVSSEFSIPKSFLVSFNPNIAGDDITPPSFKDITVKRISRELVLIEGKTEPGARLIVDDNSISIDQDGSFSDVIPIEGLSKSSVDIQLYDTAGNVSRRTFELF